MNRKVFQQFSVWLRNHFSYLTFDIIYSILFYGSAVELIEVLTRSTHINIEDSYIDIWIFITDQHRMFCGVHTTDIFS